MISRLFHTATAMLLYFCLATLIAQSIVAIHLWSKWKMDRSKLLQMLAVAQGVDPLTARQETEKANEPVSAEQPSYEQILATQAANDLNLQLREQSLDNALAAMDSQRQTLAQSQLQFDQQRQQYEGQLRELQNQTVVAGRDVNQRTLESIKPKQAKSLLMQMLQNGDLDAVVMLLREMSDGNRAKIVGEFKTPDESAKIEEVLRLIRRGMPEAGVAKAAENQRRAEQPNRL
jgi:hypothetical protein